MLRSQEFHDFIPSPLVTNCVPFGIDRVEEPPGVVPLVVDDEIDVLQALGRQGAEGLLEVLRPHPDGLPRLLRLARCRSSLEDLLVDVLHVEIELVRRARPRGATAIDPELLEVPVPRGDLRDVGRPDPVGPLRPSLREPDRR